MDERRAQSAIEFVLLVGAVLIFTLGLMWTFRQEVTEKNMERRNFLIQEFVLELQNELNIAGGASDGYMREFEIPSRLANKDFSINLYEGFIYINTTDGRNSLAVPAYNATGQFVVGGKNVIRKVSGIVRVN
jgi:hypothetical protein